MFARSDLIALAAEPNLQTLYALFGAWRLGLSVALISPKLPNAASLLQPLSPRFFFRGPSPLLQVKEFNPEQFDLEASKLLLLTSGSSGSPKWASFSLSQLFESARTVGTALDAKPGQRWLLSIPLHHVGGLGVALRALLHQGLLLFENKQLPYPERILEAKPDFASLVPTQLYRLLSAGCPALPTHFLVGGAPLAEPLYRKAIRRGLTLSLTYALTEMSSTVLLSSQPHWDGPFPFLGHPLPGRELFLSQNNELLVCGRSLFNGYGFPPQTAPHLFPTGDLGSFDPHYGWQIRGRKDFQFLSGGENIQPEEIETALLSHPEVEEAIVVPKPDLEFGARPAAYVRTRLDDQTLRTYLAERLPKYKIPVFFKPLEETPGLKQNRKNLILALAQK